MKIRIGLGLGAATDLADGATLGHIVDELERLGFDSLWFTERVNGPSLDPLVAMTFTIARTRKLKVGTSVMVLPGRNPVLLAKAIASLDRLSNGRAFPAVGLGAVNPLEQQAFAVQRHERAPWFDEALLPAGIVGIIRKREPDAEPDDVVARNHGQLCGMVEQFVAAGASKFVVLPYGAPPAGWTEELEKLATMLLPLQN